MRVAVFVNAYPSPSHTFIRREVLELESQGLEVLRFAVRRFTGELVDEDDRSEALQTRYVLDSGFAGLLLTVLGVLLSHPLAFFRVLAVALRISWRADRGVLYHIVYFSEACVLLKWCRKLKVQHVHAHFGTNSTTVPMFCRLLGGPPYSFTVHGPEEFDRPAAIALGEKIQHAKFVVAITSFCRSQLFRWCPHGQWGKVQVVHCGLDDPYLVTPLQAVPDVPRLVCVGRLCEQKGQMLLVEATHLLWEEGRRFELLFLGDGPMRPEIEAAIARYGLQECCHILGWASSAEVHEHLMNSRAMVLASFAEGLPVVIMEAMALGRPVISTWIAGIPELLEDGKSGWLIVPGCVQALADALRCALDTSVEELSTMGRHGADRVRTRHNVHREVARMAGIFLGEINLDPMAEDGVSNT